MCKQPEDKTEVGEIVILSEFIWSTMLLKSYNIRMKFSF